MEGKFVALDTDGTQPLTNVTVGLANQRSNIKQFLTFVGSYFGRIYFAFHPIKNLNFN